MPGQGKGRGKMERGVGREGEGRIPSTSFPLLFFIPSSSPSYALVIMYILFQTISIGVAPGSRGKGVLSCEKKMLGFSDSNEEQQAKSFIFIF